MREITLEVPDGVKRVSAIVKYKTKDQADNQISVATFSFDTDNLSGARVDENGEISYTIRLERKVAKGDTE